MTSTLGSDYRHNAALPEGRPPAAGKHKGVLGSLLLWPIGCILLSLLIWGFTLSRIDSDRAAAEANVEYQTTALSKSYAQQVERTIDQIAYITLQLQYDWEATKGDIDLMDRFQRGLYPSPSQLYVTVVNRKGMTETSTVFGPPVQVDDRDYFKFHRSSPSQALHVDDKILRGRRSREEVIHFSRRLTASDGSFNGVVVVSVSPDYLASFNDESSLGPYDLISIRHENGALLVSEKGSQVRVQGSVHREPPVFEDDAGIMRMPAETYHDNRTRILAWQKVQDYPLVSYVALAESTYMARHLDTAENYRRIATTAILFLLLVALGGMSFTVRLAMRKTQAEEIKRQAEETKRTFHLAVDAAKEGFFMVRALYVGNEIADFVVEDCNERGAAMVGHSKMTLLGKRLSDFSASAWRENFLTAFRLAMAEGYYEDEVKVPSLGSRPGIWLYRRMVCAGAGLAITLRDISEAKLHEHKLIDIANTDFLTGLPNRHWLQNYLPAALDNAKAVDKHLAVCYIDLDGFKSVNDTLGHQAGDELLKEAAIRLKSVLRPTDCVIRIGGDEFAVVLPNIASHAEVAQIAQRIGKAFHKPFLIADRKSPVGTSIGISFFPQDGASTEELLRKADIAMYAAKDGGKGRFRFYDQQFYERIKLRLDTEQELERAIEEDEFILYYQPRVHALTGELTGLEALIRWQHPERGIVAPVEFIPVAERNGLIIPIGIRVIEKACAQIALWQAQNETVVPLSINISPNHFNAGGVADFIAAALSRHNIPPSLLDVELTESTMMSESANTIHEITALNTLGIQIHVDDFGTGYSSLARLQEYKMNVLKIDRMFTSRMGVAKEGDAMVKTIILMAQALNMSVIAEGVETREQLRALQALECDEVQGYFIARPLPADEIVLLMRKRFLIADDARP